MTLRRATSVFFIFLFFAQLAYAANIDSLKKEISACRSEQLRAGLYEKTGEAYNSINADSAILYFHRALAIAQRAGGDQTCYDASRQIGLYYYTSGQMDSALAYDKLALRYSRFTRDQHNLCQALLDIAGTYSTNDSALACIAYADSALMLSEQLKDSVCMAGAYTMLGVGYTAIIDYASALDAVRHAIAIYEHRRAYAHLGEAYMLAANIIDLQKNFKESLEYHQLSREMLLKAHDTFVTSQNEVNTAIVYSEMGNYQKAIDIFRTILPKLKAGGTGWTTTALSLAVALTKNGNYTEAGNTFRQIEKVFAEGMVHDPLLEGEFYAGFADMYLQQKQLDNALLYAKKNEKLLSQGQPAVADVMLGMKLLSDIYRAKGDLAAAINYYTKYSDLKDTIAASEQSKNYAQAEAKFNLAERNKTIEMLSKQNELQKALNSKDRVINISLFFILGLAILFAVIGFRAYRRTLKQNALLSEQRVTIDHQMKQLADAATMKSKFLANISHELRTPVTLLTGMLDLMSKNDGRDSKEKERLDVAYNNSKKLQHMVEEILDLTKLEHNISAPVFETKEIAPLLKRILYSFETLIEKEQLTLEYEDIAAKGLYISIDPVKFEKVINNLVVNAIKFNKVNGSIRVVVAPAGPGHVEISISDTGVGIAAGDLPHIFEHFYQSGTPGIKAAGAGIGLSLVKEFTGLMEGAVTVESDQGLGSTFKLTFPRAAAPDVNVLTEVEDDLQLPDTEWEKLPRRQCVLVAEDNLEMQYYLKEVLGHRVNIVLTGNGYEALEWLAQNTADLIISDIMMPGMDGRELVTYLKSQERYCKVPIITLSALADVEHRLSMLRLGIDDYMVKPFNADELRIRAYNLLSNSAARDKFNEEQAAVAGDADNGQEAEAFRDKIKTYVLSRIKDMNITVTDLAYEFSVSERQLQRMSKSITGCTPAQLIKEVRLQKAYELLLDDSSKIYKVDDLCKRVGYDSASYFARQFYERFGKRPSDFL